MCHNLLGTNRPEGWVRNVFAWVRIVWVWKIHGYETTGYRRNPTISVKTSFVFANNTLGFYCLQQVCQPGINSLVFRVLGVHLQWFARKWRKQSTHASLAFTADIWVISVKFVWTFNKLFLFQLWSLRRCRWLIRILIGRFEYIWLNHLPEVSSKLYYYRLILISSDDRKGYDFSACVFPCLAQLVCVYSDYHWLT